MTTDDKGRLRQGTSHGRHVIVVAGNTPDRLAKVAEQRRKVLVAVRIVLHEITRQQDAICRADDTSGGCQGPLQGLQRDDAAELLGGTAEQVWIC